MPLRQKISGATTGISPLSSSTKSALCSLTWVPPPFSVISNELRRIPAGVSSHNTIGLVTAQARLSERYGLCKAVILVKVADENSVLFRLQKASQ